MSCLDDVREFHEAMDAPVAYRPEVPDARIRETRKRLIEEEFRELMVELDGDDVAAVAKETVDLVYVALGAAVEYGIDLDLVWDVVHASNMAKLGPNGKPTRREDGKILKPEGWQAPDIAALLAR
jgi:predicted HAD superfamily Cof-like phosphohydrolase